MQSDNSFFQGENYVDSFSFVLRFFQIVFLYLLVLKKLRMFTNIYSSNILQYRM